MFAAAERDPDEAYVDCLSIAEGFDLVLPANQDLHFGNHSCDPNLWHVDAFTVATRCEIGEGEELTIDYGTQADGDLRMECSCGSPLCRGTITGSDWQRADLHARYGDHWVPVLLERIRRERQ